MKTYFKKAGCGLGTAAAVVIAMIAANAPAQTNVPALPSSKDVVVLGNGRMAPIWSVETAEEQERKEIEAKATALLAAKDYDGLEAFAGNLRTSKDSWVNGTWKLANVYFGLEPHNNQPPAVWDARIDALQTWVAARPESITARVALAYVEVDYAWDARGGGWANTVTDEGWRLFEQRLQDATKVLNQAKKLQAKCPVYWTVRMRAALGLSAEKVEFDALFANALRAWPDYEPIYLRRAIYLLPRWMGEPGEWEKDLAKSADRVGGQAGDVLYAQVVWCVHKSVGMTNIFDENNLSWPRVDRGFADLEKHFPQSLAARSEHAHLAVLARDPEVASNCFEALGGRVDSSSWKSKTEYARFLTWANYGPESSNRPSATVIVNPSNPTPAPSSSAAAVKPEPQPALVLKGISGAPGHRLALINNLTFAVGESGKVRVRDTKVEVVCKEIRNDSVLVIVDGKPMELRLGAKSIAPKTDKVAQN